MYNAPPAPASTAHPTLAAKQGSGATRDPRATCEHFSDRMSTICELGLVDESRLIHRLVMPIRIENRWLYPIDWRQLSDAVRFGRAGARCERCLRPHLLRVAHLGDGRWWDAGAQAWRTAQGKRIRGRAGVALADLRTTYVVLACAHLDHDPGNNAPTNLAALCQRCHMLHDAAEHRWQRWWNAFRRRAIRDLFEDPRLTRQRLMQKVRSPRRRTVYMNTC